MSVLPWGLAEWVYLLKNLRTDPEEGGKNETKLIPLSVQGALLAPQVP